MPQYFFDTHDGDFLNRGTDGIDMRDREAARLEAHLTLGGMMKDQMPNGDTRNLYVNVRNEAGMPIYTVCLALVGRWLT